MPDRTPALSLIVPTRERIAQLDRLLRSLAQTAAEPASLEIVLVVDADDRESMAYRFDRLPVRRVVVAPGLTMGALNTAGYEASAGRYLMLLNDDVVARTRAWDRKILSRLRRYPDGIVLVHTNDNLFRELLCTFPIVSRAFCERVGGICPLEYVRYRIDDHIEDTFNLLGVLGERRTIYLPEVIFEHFRFVEEAGARAYVYDAQTLALDATRFLDLLPERKRLTVELMRHIHGPASAWLEESWRSLLAQVEDPFALRVPQRLCVERDAPTLGERVTREWQRAQECVRHRGYRGLAQALWKRVARHR